MGSSTAKPATILIIDEDRGVLDTFHTFLEDLGFKALEALSGELGIELFRSEHPDLVLVDLSMQEIGGLQVLRQIHRLSPDTPVIIVSGGGDMSDVIEALRGGAWDYLNKPVNFSMFLHAVSKALERARLLRENRDYQKHLEAEVAHRTQELRCANRELVKTNENLTRSERRYRSIFENLQDVYFEILLDGKILELSQSIGQLMAYSVAEMLKTSFWEHFILDEEKNQFLHYIKRKGRVRNFEVLLRSKNEKVVPCSLVARLHRSRGDTPARICGTIRDVTDRKVAEARIKHLAYFDDLTDLPNRRLFSDRMAVSLAHARRHGNHGALLFLDLDRFKTINDSLGHLTGDQLLLKVAKRITQNLRNEDTLARLGGDEFVILLDDLGKDELGAARQAQQAADKIRSTLFQPFHVHNHQLHISVSIGISMFPSAEASVYDLLQQADSAMYQAKESGRDCVRFFLPSMQESASYRLSLEKDLRDAMNRDEFKLYFQAQVDVTGLVTGAEVLMRWDHSRKGFVAPSEFIPIAETTGLIVPIGEWVIRQTCLEFQQWARAGLAEHLQKVSINVSPRQFHQNNFVSAIEQILAETGMNPRYLQLELTEGVVISNLARTIDIMDALKGLGLRISIDDFGTGYSSLAYLKRLPLDELKIDKSFIRDIDNDSNSAAIVSAIIAMAKHLGLEVIAEGVETSSELESLQAKGSRTFQGYFFYRPLSAGEFARLLQPAERSLQ